MNKIKFILHTKGMITLLLVCIFFGINLRVYLDFSKMQCVVSVILPTQINPLNFRISLENQRLFYKINRGKDRQIIIKKSNKDKKFSPFKITIDKLDLIMSIGCNDNCLKGIYFAAIFDYAVDLIKNFAENYVTFTSFEKIILTDFKENASKIMLNITIKKGILDIINGLISTNIKRGSYANR